MCSMRYLARVGETGRNRTGDKVCVKCLSKDGELKGEVRRRGKVCIRDRVLGGPQAVRAEAAALQGLAA